MNYGLQDLARLAADAVLSDSFPHPSDEKYRQRVIAACWEFRYHLTEEQYEAMRPHWALARMMPTLEGEP